MIDYPLVTEPTMILLSITILVVLLDFVEHKDRGNDL